jgi:hypothetical protein
LFRKATFLCIIPFHHHLSLPSNYGQNVFKNDFRCLNPSQANNYRLNFIGDEVEKAKNHSSLLGADFINSCPELKNHQVGTLCKNRESVLRLPDLHTSATPVLQ